MVWGEDRRVLGASAVSALVLVRIRWPKRDHTANDTATQNHRYEADTAALDAEMAHKRDEMKRKLSVRRMKSQQVRMRKAQERKGVKLKEVEASSTEALAAKLLEIQETCVDAFVQHIGLVASRCCYCRLLRVRARVRACDCVVVVARATISLLPFMKLRRWCRQLTQGVCFPLSPCVACVRYVPVHLA